MNWSPVRLDVYVDAFLEYWLTRLIIKRKYLEALKKFDELILMQKELYGDKSEAVIKSSQEAAIICNILSMSFLQKGK